jgi:CRP-like cAMP-binding protein
VVMVVIGGDGLLPGCLAARAAAGGMLVSSIRIRPALHCMPPASPLAHPQAACTLCQPPRPPPWPSCHGCTPHTCPHKAPLLAFTAPTNQAPTPCALQAAQLEALLAFLASLEPFAGLSRDRLTALAVCAAQQPAAPGAVLLQAGQRPSGLTIIRHGEVRVMLRQKQQPRQAAPPPVAAAGKGRQAGGGGAGGRRRVTFDVSELPEVRGAEGGGPSRLSDGSEGPQQLSPERLQRQLAQMTPAVVLAAGGMFGEECVGAGPGEPAVGPLVVGEGAGQREVHAMVVATKACELLVVSAADLKRFGRRLLAPLREAAGQRREFLQARAQQLLLARPAAALLQQQPAALEDEQRPPQQQGPAAASSSRRATAELLGSSRRATAELAASGSTSRWATGELAAGSRRATAEAQEEAAAKASRRAAAVAASAGLFASAAMYTSSLKSSSMQLPPLPLPTMKSANLRAAAQAQQGAAAKAGSQAAVAKPVGGSGQGLGKEASSLAGPAPLLSGSGRAMEMLRGLAVTGPVPASKLKERVLPSSLG